MNYDSLSVPTTSKKELPKECNCVIDSFFVYFCANLIPMQTIHRFIKQVNISPTKRQRSNVISLVDQSSHFIWATMAEISSPLPMPYARWHKLAAAFRRSDGFAIKMPASRFSRFPLDFLSLRDGLRDSL